MTASFLTLYCKTESLPQSERTLRKISALMLHMWARRIPFGPMDSSPTSVHGAKRKN